MANKHFFQPLLPGFHSHLKIPEDFFLKHLIRNCEQKTAELRSDASEVTWEVKIEDGRRLTDGWKEFALAHDLRIGDIVVFRQEKELAFHVTLLGPSCCEIQYESCLDNKNTRGKKVVKKVAEKVVTKVVIGKKKVVKNLKEGTKTSAMKKAANSEIESLSTENSDEEDSQDKRSKHGCSEASSSSENRFVTVTLTPSIVKDSRLCLPSRFTRMNGIDEETRMVLLDKHGENWSTKLRCVNRGVNRSKNIRLVGRWKDFFKVNGAKPGESIMLELIWEAATSCVLKFHSKV